MIYSEAETMGQGRRKPGKLLDGLDACDAHV